MFLRMISFIGLLTVSLSVGCASHPISTSFQPGEQVISEPVAEAILLVVEGDERPLQGESHVGSGFFAWIPLIPYGHQQLSPGELLFTEVSDTVLKDLRAAGIAQYVAYQDRIDPRQRSLKEPYFLHLTLKEGIWDRYFTLYGVSFAGAFLWFAGFPISYGDILLDIEAELKDSEGNSLGSQIFKGKKNVTEWLYYPLKTAYGPKLPKAYAQIPPQLRQFIMEKIKTETP